MDKYSITIDRYMKPSCGLLLIFLHQLNYKQHSDNLSYTTLRGEMYSTVTIFLCILTMLRGPRNFPAFVPIENKFAAEFDVHRNQELEKNQESIVYCSYN